MTETLIVALDLDSRAAAERLVAALEGEADFFKIGYQLTYGGDGLALGKALIAAKKRVFFDLKLLDIDNTVEKGAAAIAATGAQVLTVHAYPKAMAAARRGAAGAGLGIWGERPASMDDADVAAAGYARVRPASCARAARRATPASPGSSPRRARPSWCAASSAPYGGGDAGHPPGRAALGDQSACSARPRRWPPGRAISSSAGRSPNRRSGRARAPSAPK